jgi:hypothetical protein
MPQRIVIFGPNLSGAGQRKGTLHVHAAECADCRLYGPGRKYGGDDYGGAIGETWSFEAATRRDVVMDVYPPEDFDYDPTTEEIRSYSDDIYFAPCVVLPWEAV